jgi:hypothetical protein
MPTVLQTNDYQIKIETHGRAGWVHYSERSTLSFPWEIRGFGGVSISIPAVEEWGEFCLRHGAEWAQIRRNEILQRVAKSYLRKLYRNGSIEIEDKWIEILPGPSLFSRILIALSKVFKRRS